jgi:hypothetical protein
VYGALVAATLEEVTTWSPDEIRAAIRDLLPKGWAFEEKPFTEGSRRIRLLRPGEKELEVEWSEYHIDARLLLLGAYGHLWLRQHQPHRDSPWVRRNNPTREAVTRRVNTSGRSHIPDPADVDPDEVEAVYEEARRKKL